MSGIFEIPLSAKAQSFSVDLASQRYRFSIRWNDAPLGGWILDIADKNSAPLISGIPLTTGNDLLAQYTKYNFGGQLLMATDGDPDLPPTIDSMGLPGGAHMYWVET